MKQGFGKLALLSLGYLFPSNYCGKGGVFPPNTVQGVFWGAFWGAHLRAPCARMRTPENMYTPKNMWYRKSDGDTKNGGDTKSGGRTRSRARMVSSDDDEG